MKRVLCVFGTRPEAIKLAPVIHRLRSLRDRAELVVCSTGQHREMLDETMRALEITPDHELRIMQQAQHPTDVLGRLLLALRPLLEEVRPDVILVQGDTTTVMGTALAGFLGRAKIGHVEAGLRTRDKHSPFPEEINRRVAGVTADYHFPPTPNARDALLAEGVPKESVFLTGNTVVDALRWMRERLQDGPLPAGLDLQGERLILITAHRRESFGQPFRELCLALRDIAERFRDARLVYPVHLNPNVQEPVREILGGCDRIELIPPVPYSDFVRLLVRADLILTDSGGIQEEAPALAKPVLVLRDKTERPEAVAAGVVKLVGTDREHIVSETSRLLSDASAYALMAREVNVYGDGLASQRIAEVVVDGRMITPPFEPDV